MIEDFNPLLLPDLDSAEVIELKDMRFSKYAHIEYVRKQDGSILRVFRPHGDEPPFFYIPIKSLDNEYMRDLEIIRKGKIVELSLEFFRSENGDDGRDNDWTNENCFSKAKMDEE